MSELKLLPCPFCGSDAMATKCILPTLLHKSDCYMITKETEAWNRRATSHEAELRECLREVMDAVLMGPELRYKASILLAKLDASENQ